MSILNEWKKIERSCQWRHHISIKHRANKMNQCMRGIESNEDDTQMQFIPALWDLYSTLNIDKWNHSMISSECSLSECSAQTTWEFRSSDADDLHVISQFIVKLEKIIMITFRSIKPEKLYIGHWPSRKKISFPPHCTPTPE